MPFPSTGLRRHGGSHKTHSVLTWDTFVMLCGRFRGDPYLSPPFEDGSEQLMTLLTFCSMLRI